MVRGENRKILKASAYYLEDVIDLDLDERAGNGYLSFLLLNQPPVCDYRCRRCFMPDYRRKKYSKKDALNIDDYKKIINDAKENGVMCLEISGEGEPLLSENLLHVIEYASKSGLMTTLITNGNTLEDGQARFLKDKNVTLIFSLHTLDKEKYETDNECKGSFERKMKNMKKAVRTYGDTKRYENGFEVYRIAMHATLQKDNVHEIDDLRKYCHDNDIFFSIAPLALIGSAIKHKEIHPENGEKSMDEIIWKGDNSIIHSHSSKKAFGREVCGTAYYGMNIGWDGSILLDAHYGYEIGERNILGNIRDIPFKEAVKKQRIYAKKLFENIDNSCPVRDKKGKEFLSKVLNNEINLSGSE